MAEEEHHSEEIPSKKVAEEEEEDPTSEETPSKNLTKGKFLELQYNALTREIDLIQKQQFAARTGILLIVPVAQGVSSALNTSVITLLLPAVMLGLILMLAADTRSVESIGNYIRSNIETAIPEVKGWEQWVKEDRENQDYRRKQDYLHTLAGAVFWAPFYLVAIGLAATVQWDMDPVLSLILSICLSVKYGLVPLWFYSMQPREFG